MASHAESQEQTLRARSTRLPRHERRRQLLDAGLEVFVSQGYHAAAMDEIAERAGVSKPVLYQHFPGKLELYLALLDESTAALVDTMRDALASNLEDPKQRVAATFGAYFEYVDGNGQAYRLVFESDLSNEPAVRDRLEQVQRQCADIVSQAIAEGAEISDDEAHLIGVGLVGMAQVTARYWLSTRGHLPREAAEQLVARLAWRGISGFPRTLSDQIPEAVGAGKFDSAESEAYSVSVGQMEIDIYLDTDEEDVASSAFMAIDALARTLGVEDIALTEIRRGSFIRRSKASFQATLSNDAVQQRLQTLERLIELWQVDPRQAEVDHRTSEALARMINSLDNVPRACIRFGSLLIVKYPEGSGYVLLGRQLSQPEIWAFEKYPELQCHPETVLNALALAVSGNNEPKSAHSDKPIQEA